MIKYFGLRGMHLLYVRTFVSQSLQRACAMLMVGYTLCYKESYTQCPIRRRDIVYTIYLSVVCLFLYQCIIHLFICHPWIIYLSSIYIPIHLLIIYHLFIYHQSTTFYYLSVIYWSPLYHLLYINPQLCTHQSINLYLSLTYQFLSIIPSTYVSMFYIPFVRHNCMFLSIYYFYPCICAIITTSLLSAWELLLYILDKGNSFPSINIIY